MEDKNKELMYKLIIGMLITTLAIGFIKGRVVNNYYLELKAPL